METEVVVPLINKEEKQSHLNTPKKIKLDFADLLEEKARRNSMPNTCTNRNYQQEVEK